MIKDFLQHLNIKLVRDEGVEQYLCSCPFCGHDKFYINKLTGLWDCKRGCGDGNPFKLVERITTKRGSEIFATLEQFGLTDGSVKKDRGAGMPRPELSLKTTDVRELTDDELKAFAAVKGLDVEALRAFDPLILREKPIVLLPLRNPIDNEKPSGYLQVNLDGSPFVRGEERPKYVLMKHSQTGLLGIRHLKEKNPDMIILCEGWRDALAAIRMGYPATASSGAGVFKREWAQFFANKDVYICYDTDTAGKKGSERTSGILYGIARNVYVVDLPTDIKDLYDYSIVINNDKDKFITLLRNGACCRKITSLTPITTKSGSSSTFNNNGMIVLDNDDPDTIAEAFESFSQERKHVKHRFNTYDGWSLYSKDQYQLIDQERNLEAHIRTFVRRNILFRKDKKSGDGVITINVRPDKKHKTDAYVRSIMNWLSSLDNIYLLPGQRSPCSLDGCSLLSNKTIALQNGLLDVRNPNSPVLHPFTEQFYTLNYLPIKYDPAATAPTWLSLLNFYFMDDANAIEVVHSWIKRFLFRVTTPHKIFAIVGPKRSGKSTIGRVIEAVLGKRNISTLTLTFLAHRFGLQPLISKQLGIMWDAQITGKNTDVARAVELMKCISGEDALLIDRKSKDPLDSVSLKFNILLIANALMDLRDDTGALASRFTFLETMQSFYGHEDSTMEDKVKAEELPGVLNLILKAPDTILEHPKSEAIKTIFSEMSSPQIAFVNEYCELDPSYFIPREFLYQYYRKWAEDNNHHPMSPQTFKSKFRNLIPGVNPDYYPRMDQDEIRSILMEYKLDQRLDHMTKNKDRVWCYQGIDVKQEVKDAFQS